MDKLSSWYFYIDSRCNYIKQFLERNPEFNNKYFIEFVINKNKADRDSGELADIAKHEILRLAYEWIEKQWRFPNVHDRKLDWNK